MSRRTGLIATVMLVAALSQAPGALADPMIADVQVVVLDGGRYVITLRSGEAQAFDVLAGGPRAIDVRLYRARLGATVVSGTYPFGTISATEDPAGVLFHIAYRGEPVVAVGQGMNANTVEVRIFLRRPAP